MKNHETSPYYGGYLRSTNALLFLVLMGFVSASRRPNVFVIFSFILSVTLK